MFSEHSKRSVWLRERSIDSFCKRYFCSETSTITQQQTINDSLSFFKNIKPG